MSGKVARVIRRFANSKTVGLSIEETRKYYKIMKLFYKKNHKSLVKLNNIISKS